MGRWQYCAVTHANPLAALRRRSRWRALGAMLLAVLALHALVLGLLPVGVGDGWRGDARPPMQARRITLPPPPAAELALPPPPPEARAPAEAPPARVARSGAPPEPPRAAAPPAAPPLLSAPTAPAANAPAPVPVPAAAPPAAPDTAPAVAAAASAPVAAPPTAPPAAEAGGEVPPVYATRLPPPLHLRYDLRRGAMSAAADLVWQPGADGYEASFEGSMLGLPVIAWTSRGRFDAAGIAPERFVDRRRSRSAQAANFQRAAGRITFSGSGEQYALLPGAQDRLTWLLQLAGIVAAAPERFGPGTKIAMQVVGARGDAEVWTFDVERRESTAVARQRIEGALHLRREPRKPFDTRADVWLDPARHHLPARVRLEVAGSGEVTEFSLTGYEPR